MSEVTFKEFQKLELKAGKVISAESTPGSSKLLKLKVDFGLENRQIIAGIAQWYKPEDLVNKSFIFVTNLEARKMMGLESQGMILCADFAGRAVCLSPVETVPAGTPIH
ncbi:MAG: methionine--tRNA ligase [Candidatus Woykebacteria bacterium RIFCSPHIGHO2_12_FULL_45_10]|uniref:Methionine--tRNA ligase n=1 Tax=Candidatus Woykebacteria bacterium RIFCSPHIGHO2_12_FULL_45_10 TaxID=1802603 RepID=A0A1G1WNL4_9BACT|nr:MAG: methionine--tRNA ligase [Candidatus Woykebacteria bacterium RIFCSPHIGHO2_12_FULL_45_10]